MTTGTRAVVIVTVLGVLAMLALVTSLLQRGPPADAAAVDEGKQVVALINVTNPHLTKLHAVADAKARTAHFIADTGATKAEVGKTLDAALADAKTARDSIPVLLQEVAAFRLSTDYYRRAFFAMSAAHQADSIGRDSLEHIIARAAPALSALVRVGDCRIFRLGPIAPRCIPRRTSFALGALAMLGVGLALHVHL